MFWFKWFCFILPAVYIMLLLPPGLATSTAFAADNGEHKLVLNKMNLWSDGAEADIQKSGLAGQFNALVDTSGLPQGYYSAYFFDYSRTNWSGMGAIAFDIANSGNGVLKINFVVKGKERNALTLEDGGYCAVTDSRGLYETVFPVNGAVELPPGYSGRMVIPFSGLSYKGENYRISNPESWGIVIVAQEGTFQEATFGGFTLFSEERARDLDDIIHKEILGSSEIPLPSAGERVSRYSVRQERAGEVVFSLEGNPEGASINKRGEVTLTADMKASSIRIVAESEDGSFVKKEVRLIAPWVTGETTANGTPLQIPRADQVDPVYDSSCLLYNEAFYKSVSLGVLIVTVLLALIYRYLRYRLRAGTDRN